MEKYIDINWDSWIESYEIWEDFIKIMFKNKKIYIYNTFDNWVDSIEKMKSLAKNGDWLNSYINKNKPKYEKY